MRCPKCHYISFGSGDRCRNCGYELALAPEAKPLDLPIQNADDPIGPLGDFPLTEPPASSSAPPSSGRDAAASARRGGPAARLDLPLFEGRPVPDDAPLVSAPAVPRTPLSVRRGQPALARNRAEKPATTDEPELDMLHMEHRPAPASRARAVDPLATGPTVSHAVGESADAAAASVVARLFAGIVDLLTLAAINAGVFYFTLRVLELTFADVRLLPPVPLGVFLLLLNGGYLAAFTAAGGQTIGKMLAGIKVVSEHPDGEEGSSRAYEPVSLGSAVLRAAAYLVSLAPAGLGFAPILFAADGRALHDRLANTRVIKA
jgi:uncharacterized RDD family membrane protein YckC